MHIPTRLRKKCHLKFFKSASWWRYKRPICVFTCNCTNLCETLHAHSLEAKEKHWTAFFTSAFYSATRRPTYVKYIFGDYSFRFCPKNTQIGTLHLHSHVILMDLSDISYSILFGLQWLPKFAGLVSFKQNASKHECSVQFP